MCLFPQSVTQQANFSRRARLLTALICTSALTHGARGTRSAARACTVRMGPTQRIVCEGAPILLGELRAWPPQKFYSIIDPS